MIALKVSACLLSGSQLLVAGERCSDGLCSCVLAVGGRAEHSALLLKTVTAQAKRASMHRQRLSAAFSETPSFSIRNVRTVHRRSATLRRPAHPALLEALIEAARSANAAARPDSARPRRLCLSIFPAINPLVLPPPSQPTRLMRGLHSHPRGTAVVIERELSETLFLNKAPSLSLSLSLLGAVSSPRISKGPAGSCNRD
jgi:hypothetical protein